MSVSAETNHTSPPGLGLNPSQGSSTQGSLLPYNCASQTSAEEALCTLDTLTGTFQ